MDRSVGTSYPVSRLHRISAGPPQTRQAPRNDHNPQSYAASAFVQARPRPRARHTDPTYSSLSKVRQNLTEAVKSAFMHVSPDYLTLDKPYRTAGVESSRHLDSGKDGTQMDKPTSSSKPTASSSSRKRGCAKRPSSSSQVSDRQVSERSFHSSTLSEASSTVSALDIIHALVEDKDRESVVERAKEYIRMRQATQGSRQDGSSHESATQTARAGGREEREIRDASDSRNANIAKEGKGTDAETPEEDHATLHIDGGRQCAKGEAAISAGPAASNPETDLRVEAKGIPLVPLRGARATTNHLLEECDTMEALLDHRSGAPPPPPCPRNPQPRPRPQPSRVESKKPSAPRRGWESEQQTSNVPSCPEWASLLRAAVSQRHKNEEHDSLPRTAATPVAAPTLRQRPRKGIPHKRRGHRGGHSPSP
eukprot:GGOE01049767.1.p1 GENE.GGOE01049767.1~~GGOE01049767.1.p1  ORF type:complete len:423 (-),score=33.95 GGOE01049767.1:312-1580(-)